MIRAITIIMACIAFAAGIAIIAMWVHEMWRDMDNDKWVKSNECVDIKSYWEWLDS